MEESSGIIKSVIKWIAIIILAIIASLTYITVHVLTHDCVPCCEEMKE